MSLQEVIEQAMPRHIEPEDWLRFRRSIAEILMALGLEVDSPATAGTPERFLQALLRRDYRLRGRPQALDDISDRVPL
jgi:hypothetical protein